MTHIRPLREIREGFDNYNILDNQSRNMKKNQVKCLFISEVAAISVFILPLIFDILGCL